MQARYSGKSSDPSIGSLTTWARSSVSRTHDASNIRDYYTIAGPSNPRGKTQTEAIAITGLIPDAKRAIVYGTDSAAELTYSDMKFKLGEVNVLRLRADPTDRELQTAAREFGADVLLGVRREGNSATRPGRREGGVRFNRQLEVTRDWTEDAPAR